jgi:ubiquinone/menaquinone biosynthesis C-methylase UbiE
MRMEQRMHLLMSLLRVFFRLLYHQFAWTYDLVASVVSVGRWQRWVAAAIPYLDGRVLEIGFGPGHLQEILHGQGLPVFGLDESPQMSRQASRRLNRKGYASHLTNGYAQNLPFRPNSFESMVSTFPAEYIFETRTLTEAWRVLTPGGRLVILPTAWITGKGPLDRLAAGLFRATGQAGAIEATLPGFETRLRSNGFDVRHELVEYPGSRILVILATKATTRPREMTERAPTIGVK